MSYIITTGYCGDKEELFQLWYENTQRYADPKPKEIYVINGGSKPLTYGNCQWVNAENLNHMGGIDPSQQLCGWSMSFLMGLMLAYHNRADLIYKEQDCLAFGPWVRRLYEESQEYGAIIGRKNEGPGIDSFYGQSLVLVKNRFLMKFLSIYTGIEETDKTYLPENKFETVMKKTKDVTLMTFGYDRTKPFYPDLMYYFWYHPVPFAVLSSL